MANIKAYVGRFVAVDPPLANGKWRVGAPGEYGVADPYVDLSLGALGVYPDNFVDARGGAVQEFRQYWSTQTHILAHLVEVVDAVIDHFYGPLPKVIERIEDLEQVGQQAALCRGWLDSLASFEQYQLTTTSVAGPLLLWQRYYHALALLLEVEPQQWGEGVAFLQSWQDLEHEYRRALRQWSGILLATEHEWFVYEVLTAGGKVRGTEQAVLLWEDRMKALIWLPNGQMRTFFLRETGLRLLDQLARQWFLPRYDLVSVSRICQDLVRVRVMPKPLQWLLLRFYQPDGQPWTAVVAAALLLVSSRWLGLGGILAALLLLGLMVGLLFVGSIMGGLGRFAFYPFSLRLATGTIVGLLALSGLTEQFNDFAFNAFGGDGRAYRWETSLLVLGSALLSTSIYLLVSTMSRLNHFQLAYARTWRILCFGWAQSTIFAALFAWVGAGRLFPLGLAGQAMPRHAQAFWGGMVYFDYLVTAGVLALTVGAFTQIFWDEKSAAEPL